MTEKLDAALRYAMEKMMRIGPHPLLSDSQPVVDAVRAIVREEIEAAIAKRLAEYFK